MVQGTCLWSRAGPLQALNMDIIQPRHASMHSPSNSAAAISSACHEEQYCSKSLLYSAHQHPQVPDCSLVAGVLG